MAELPDGTSPESPVPGKPTVTVVHGGEGFSVTADLCTLNVDIRTVLALLGAERSGAPGGRAGVSLGKVHGFDCSPG
jgi:hypothetical protein